jgi:serine/threonine-protein kinase
MLLRRYRIVGLVGRGGMGEVYRADDTKLGQTVALKFLPETLARDADSLARFYAEVRIGRQIAHPNVCGLYDLIEVDGHHCLSMEYVDGEDLSKLLKRIGRLPADKAIEITRELCAGLAAVHDKGMIHRDLKPANVMIDGRGRVRITDFGLAASAEEIGGESFAGTPAYMAPEQLAGKPATQQSDIYTLGLILYETFTGKRLFDGRTLAEINDQHASMRQPTLSSSARDIPAAVEQAILSCLQKNPDARPLSVHAVMATLPGVDPLEAALAAGETPSPAMVAAAGTIGELQPAIAWGYFLAALVGLLLAALLAGRSTLIGRIAPDKSLEVLTEKAKETLATLGYNERPHDSNASFSLDRDYLAYVATHEPASKRWNNIAAARPGPLVFIYRQSPQELVAKQTMIRPFGPSEAGRVTRDDPPATTPGSVDVSLDRQGRLIGLRAVPAPVFSGTVGHEPDWNLLLTAAGLESSLLTATEPRSTAPVDTDRKAAWQGSYRDQPGVVFHIEAAAFRGQPVWFDVQGPWARPRMEPRPTTFRSTVVILVIISFFGWVAIGVLVRRNMRMGRGDRQGALRLTGFLFACSLIAQLLRADHVALSFEETSLLTNLMAQALLYAVITWMNYMALEPIARRRWPQLLVGWSRLLAGRLRDPLVGRDVLVGGLTGVVLTLVVHLAVVVPTWLGWTAPAPRFPVATNLGAFRHLAYYLFWSPYPAVIVAFGTLFQLFLYRVVLRSNWLAFVVLGIAEYFIFTAFTNSNDLWSLSVAVFTAIYMVVALRVGLLAATVAFYVFLVLVATPLTLDLSSWLADRTVVSMTLLFGLLLYGFLVSVGRKPLLGNALLERDG